MNYDRINLLSHYSPAEADWGIEETFPPRNRFNSTTTSEFSQPPPIRYPDFGRRSPSLSTGHYGFLSDQDFFSYAQTKPSLSPTTENFHKYITHYLSSHERSSQIVEKFRYNLIISNLLDDTLVLSKNELALNDLVRIRASVDAPMHDRLAKQFNFDGTELIVTNKRYQLKVPNAYRDPSVTVRSIWLIVFLMKQNLKSRSNLSASSKLKLFKILLIVSTRILKYRRAASIIGASRTLRALDDFMISNCKINKALITNMITIKEFEMFIFLNKSDSKIVNATYSRDLKFHVNTALVCLTLNVRHSIRRLLPLSNGEILEKYCHINNIQLGSIFAGPETMEEEEITLDVLTSKLNYFNNLRRFFICQLLTIHDVPLQNFFILKLYDCFNLHESSQRSYSAANRLNVLEHVFSEHTSALEQILVLNDNFRGLHNPQHTTDYANDNVLTKRSYGTEKNDYVFASDTELNLNNLINKLHDLTTSLKYFKKYSQSISEINDAEEYDEKLTIFKLFNDELKASFEVYKTCLGEYQAEFSLKFENRSPSSSQSNSQRSSYNSNDHFSLKSFHTSSSARKRNSPIQLAETAKDLRGGSLKVSDKKSKRMSTGLLLSLLTVLEEPRGSGLASPREKVISNGLTLPSGRDSYNQSALDALTKKIGIRNPSNRFSINSLNSNISGISELIASTHITTDEDDIDRPKGNVELTQEMTKEDLKKKLEESFSRIYNLENENQELKSKTFTDVDCENEELERTEGFGVRDIDFTKQLERTLEKGHTS
ncbi:CIC11C00000001912 [Sungouiella intermedia]|uniref:CIC11C00000001912 n=1 Tax=Sungouiella intermedia TaxID=45354 RepID=A0A1L0BB36_9ASCO|nr:CIC11C00000001912 [[Candida] intermedia]